MTRSTLYIYHTTAGRFFTPQHGVDHGSSTAHPWTHIESFGRAISGTGTTFHTSVPVHDIHLPIGKAYHGMRADKQTHSAPDASFLIKF
jgi:hypothetical protein